MKVGVMGMFCRQKLERYEDVRRALEDSYPLFIIKHIRTGPPPDGFWDSGIDQCGRNMMGKIWERLRKSFFAERSAAA